MDSAARSHTGFTLVEIVVALVLVGAAGAGLASGIGGHGRLRYLATQHTLAGERARTHLELLAVRRCTADTAAALVESWGTDAWQAIAAGGVWTSTDSFALRRIARPVVIEARVSCPD